MERMVLWAIEQERRAEVVRLRRAKMAVAQRAGRARRPTTAHVAALVRRMLSQRRRVTEARKEYGDVFTSFE
jgi:DNA invertase Pin-like site-specific DNA recombinase